MNGFRVLVISSLLGPALLTGCAATVQPPPPTGLADPYGPAPQITVLDQLDRFVVVSDAMMEPGPPMDVTVMCRANTEQESLYVQYRFIFLDDRGRRLEREPDWRFITMPARAPIEMRGNALDSRASDWRLEIRSAR
jgi:hypothetical protein